MLKTLIEKNWYFEKFRKFSRNSEQILEKFWYLELFFEIFVPRPTWARLFEARLVLNNSCLTPQFLSRLDPGSVLIWLWTVGPWRLTTLLMRSTSNLNPVLFSNEYNWWFSKNLFLNTWGSLKWYSSDKKKPFSAKNLTASVAKFKWITRRSSSYFVDWVRLIPVIASLCFRSFAMFHYTRLNGWYVR